MNYPPGTILRSYEYGRDAHHQDWIVHADGTIRRSEPERMPDRSAPIEWRGWKISVGVLGWVASKSSSDKIHELVDHSAGRLLDRIAEAEGLSTEARDVEHVKKQLATERQAREKAEKERDQVRDVQSHITTTWREQCNLIKDAFRAATGQEYEPGRDYSHIRDALSYQLKAAQQGQASISVPRLNLAPDLRVQLEKPQAITSTHPGWEDDPKSMPPGTVFRFTSFPEDYGQRPSNTKSEFVMGSDGKASYNWLDTEPVNAWPVAGCGVKILSAPEPEIPEEVSAMHQTSPSKKGSRMLSLLKFFPKALPWVLVGYLSVANYSSDVYDWWTGPTQLYLGDWVQVISCDDCGKVRAGAHNVCPHCGSTSLQFKAGQELVEDCFLGRDGPWMGGQVRGWAYSDGTNALSPGDWKMPERDITVTEEAAE